MFRALRRFIRRLLHGTGRRKSRARHDRPPQDVRKALGQVNAFRKRNKKPPVTYDQRAYRLARARLRDLDRHHYFAHVNPRTGASPATMKGSFGFSSSEYAAENLFGGGVSGDFHRAIKARIRSPLHRRNLLWDHQGCAIASYKGNVVFIGVNRSGLGHAYLGHAY